MTKINQFIKGGNYDALQLETVRRHSCRTLHRSVDT